MNNNIQCSIESSTASINLNSAEDGIYLTPELEGLAGLPEIRTSSGVNAGYDGGWTSAQNYDARLITLRGVIANPDISLVEQKRRQLASIVGQGRKESLTLHFTTEAGRAYTCDVRTISCEMALQRVLTKQDFIIQLRADNPLIYDDSGGSTAGIINVQKELGGFEIDFELPLAIGGGTDISTIVNEGETSNPTIVLNGALHSPTIVNQTTNQQMQILADLEQTPIYSDQISASGNPISFDIDTEYGGKIEELKLNGNAEQVTYSGKNLMPMAVSDNTSTRQNTFRIDLPVGTYTVSFDLSNITLGSNASFTPYMKLADANNGNAKDFSLMTINSSTTAGRYYTTFTLNTAASVSGTSDVHIPQTYWNNGARCKLSNIQIESGSSMTAYEPFTNGPSPNPDYPQDINVVTGAQNVEVVGKNLFGGLEITGVTRCTATLNGTTLTVTPNNTTQTTAVTLSLGSKIPAGTYTLNSATFLSNTTQLRSSSSAIAVYSFGSNYSNQTFTIEEVVDGIRFNWNAASTTDPFTVDLSTLQIELGNQATTYEPYQGQSYTIDLGSIELAKIGTYQDYIWNDGGTWKVHKAVGKVVYTGASGENWQYQSTRQYFSMPLADYQPPSSNSVVGSIISDYFSPASLDAIYLGTDNAIGLHATAGVLWTSYHAITSAADFKTWLSTHNTTVYYALATPTDTAITEQTLIDQLNAVANAQLYSGQNNIINIAFSPNLAGELEIGYVEMEGYDRDQIIIDSQNQTVTMNGENIYDKIADGSEFITMASGDNKMFLTSEVTSDTGYAEVKFKQGFISI